MKQTKNKLLSLLGILALGFALFSCETQVEPPAPTTYTVTYTSEHGTVPEAITVEENTVLSEEQLPTCSYGGLVFKGWFDGDTKAVPGEYTVTDNVTLTARWASTATVSYHSKNGTVPESFDAELHQTLTAENLTPITCSPYVFLGWFYGKDANNNGTGTIAKAGDSIDADVYLYAKWETKTITYHSKFGTAPESLVIEKNRGLASEMLSAPADCSPYTFEGWYSSKDGEDNGTGTKVQAGDKITDNTDLYAKWKKATVSFTTEHGTQKPSVTKYSGEKITEAEIPSVTSRDYYTTSGWFNGTTKLTTNYVVENDVQFVEKWTPIEYPINYLLDEGVLPTGTQRTFNVEETVALATPTKEGKIFGGWYTKSDCYPDSKISGWNAGDRHDSITVYALWGDADSSNIYDLLADIDFNDYRNTSVKNYVLVGDWTDDDMVTLQNAIYNHENIIEKSNMKQFLGKSWVYSLDLSHIDVKTVKLIGKSSLKGTILPWMMTSFEGSLIATMPNTSGTWEHYDNGWKVTSIPGPASRWGGSWRKVN